MPDARQFSDETDRALGALIGGALGDALGMPTQILSPAEIARTYGFVDGFVSATADHPVSRGLAAGTITDDTEQAVLLGRVLLRSGEHFNHRLWVDALLDWEREVKARGSYDLLGPSTKRALDAINAGVSPEEAGRAGDTNGAAMRIAPVGIATPLVPLDALVSRVAETCRATHNTNIAIASATAVAAAVSHGVSGGSWKDATDQAIAAARLGTEQGYWIAGPDIAARIAWARELVHGKSQANAIRLIVDLVGTGVASQQSIPAAFAVLEVADGDPWKAAVISANLGGDTDTIGAIATGIAGACSGFANLPAAEVARLKGIDLEAMRQLAENLVGTRLNTRPAGKDAAA